MTVGKTILVECPKEEYEAHRDKLRGQGLKEWKDFKWYKFADKKVCLISANCHGPVLEQYLLTQKSFTDIYAIHPFMAHGGYLREGMHTPLDDELLSGVDLLLYQHMRTENSMSYTYADENILAKVPKQCECVSVPNYWPLGGVICQSQTLDLLKNRYGGEAFYRDELLDMAYERAWKKDIKTIKLVLADFEIDSQQATEKANSIMERLARRDERTDIKTIDFVRLNYKMVPLFRAVSIENDILQFVLKVV